MRILPLLFTLLALAACTDSASPGSPDASPDASADAGSPDASPGDAGSEYDEEGCRILTLGERDFQFNIFGQLTGLRYRVAPNLEGALGDHLLVELYDSTTGGLPPLATGDFDLAAPPNDNLATCQHCFWVKIDETEEGTVEAIYLQTRGTLTLDRVSDPFEPVFAGSTSRVVLKRATVTEEGRSVFDPDGDCVSIDTVAFDTAPAPGRTCLSAEDCGNALLEICDPTTSRCMEPQCGEFLFCPEVDQVCVSQYRELFYGACYDTCDPLSASSACGLDQRCVQFGVDPGFGLCKYPGDAAPGASCAVTDNGTSCTGDAVCSAMTETCSPTCGFFDAATGCAGGSACSLFGVCEPASIGSPAALGEPCGLEDELAVECAAEGQAFRGICFAYPPEPLICEKACLGDRGCGTGEFCAMRFTSGLGVCRPVPVCGDGELGEIDELCDDGNTASGDGCAGDCRSVEYDVICGGLPALSFAEEVQGDTTSARDGFLNTCQLGTARASLFAVTPPGPGRLRFQLTSPTNHTLALRDDCDDPGSELACAEESFGGETEELLFQVTSTHALALTAVVSAHNVLEQGPFTLRADFIAESCGDGIIAGREVCDDGNTTSDDGCRGDCREVEYDFYCSGAAPLSTTTINTGDTTGAAHLYVNRCSGDVGGISGADRLFRYVAPSSGELHLRLESEHSLVVSVRDGCGRPDEAVELACNPIFTLGTVDVPLAAGQEITVLVDGFLPTDQGPFELHAMFTAD